MDIERLTPEGLVAMLADARRTLLGLVGDLDDEQMLGPRLSIVNPLLWEMGHVAWFHEKWCLRHLRGEKPVLEHGDALYDSAAVAHDTRWDLPLPSRQATLLYMQEVFDRIAERLLAESRTQLGEAERYFHLLGLYHEDMHAEAFGYTRQTLGHPAPEAPSGDGGAAARPEPVEPVPGDVEVPGGVFLLGAPAGAPFVFDNEKWAHPVEVRPFAIARTAVTQAELAAFVEDGGYVREELWSAEGWRWVQRAGARHPVYWQREPSGRWLRRAFDQMVPLEERLPALHVCWYEADAYCRWAGRRLASEAEWELAAAGRTPAAGSAQHGRKPLYPWGDAPPDASRAHLDWRGSGCVEVDRLADGDSALGCRQMVGNVWEWTASDFQPYPGFVADPYKEYSEPWFGDHKVLRGGCWATRSRLIRNTWRNFYTPDRRDVWAGFRTCAS
jgi:gamma-glutamyl hercynylcysteine S-oxide synthase